MSERPVAVIGAGFSGTMAALHLLPRIGTRAVLLCERGVHFARGIAYGTGDPWHLLNVRAVNMSAYGDCPRHFLDWLGVSEAVDPAEVHVTPAGTFVSRHLYGNYLASLLTNAVAGTQGASRLILVHDEVVDLVPNAEGYDLILAGGMIHHVSGAILAAGNLLADERRGKRHVTNPWASPIAEGLRDGEPVVVIGTGLTMVDIALHLRHAGFTGPIVALSRRGLRPHTHAPTVRWPTPSLTEQERVSPASLLRRLRQEVVEANRRGATWQSVVDSLRPITSELWRGLSAARQTSFLNHARPWWDVHRHRTAPPVGQALENMLASGFLTIRAGHIVSIAEHDRGADVAFRPRGTSATETITAQRVVDALGTSAPERCSQPLVRQLIERGLVRQNRHGLGLDQTADLHLIAASGARNQKLWALGPLGAGSFWECVAVPDIRQQAQRVAGQVSATLDGSVETGSA